MMWGSGWWFGGLLWMVLFWGLLVAGVVWLVRAITDVPGRGGARAAIGTLREPSWMSGSQQVSCRWPSTASGAGRSSRVGEGPARRPCRRDVAS
jgi:hypothetical protein